MFSLTICFGPQATAWAFMFKTKESAEAAATTILLDHVVKITDDFGQTAVFAGNQIHGHVLEDMNISKLAHQERALHMERMKAAVTMQIQSDPAMRAARNGQGPGIVSPFTGMAGPR
jgi:hypothetical protein